LNDEMSITTGMTQCKYALFFYILYFSAYGYKKDTVFWAVSQGKDKGLK